MKIPVLNIYYMLSYSWNSLEESGIIKIERSEYQSLKQLFARVLATGTKHLIKRSIDRSYITKTGEYRGIKGKLLINETLTKNLLSLGKSISKFDELDPNIVSNQILKSTIYSLLKDNDIDKDTHKQLKSTFQNFHKVDYIILKRDHFRKIQFHRNNRQYNLLIRICKLIFDNSTLNEKEGTYIFRDFTRDDKKMALLFQSFICNFYKRHYNDLSVSGEIINWAFESENENDTHFLPKMRTDITIENTQQKIIIDTKYYSKTLSTYFDSESFHSENLYQLFSYLLNQEEKGNSPKFSECTGVLLYPKVDVELMMSFKYKTHNIFIRTIDLSQEWNIIEENLKLLIADINISQKMPINLA